MLELVHGRLVGLSPTLQIGPMPVTVFGIRIFHFCIGRHIRPAYRGILFGYVFGEEWCDRLACLLGRSGYGNVVMTVLANILPVDSDSIAGTLQGRSGIGNIGRLSARENVS